ncbi:MAG TPA: LacI family DNA-binding transcriptional regulator [Thermotogota bacterium]|nr:LacI family DNA-binding transcriptional regulator [Thermotogota bacterium]HPJ88342.1 LacI family DNA-binding transcriptional regulator [Thermotogota bacterium]HPR95490.1 LacI family DNA-binding transcriptional regulator [Thermotogota bacterium]
MSSINDVARLAGVSTATVSRVISGKGYVSEETRKIVQKVIEELEYTPSKTASGLARRKNFRIGAVFSERILNYEKNDGRDFLGDGFYTTVFRGIKEKAGKLNMTVNILMLEDQRKQISSDYDAFLLIGGDVTEEDVLLFRACEKTFILVDQHLKGCSVDSVVSNGYDGAVSCVTHLIEEGYSRIFHIHGPLLHYGFKDRYEGYRDAMKQYGFFPRTFQCDDINDDFNLLLPQIFKNEGMPDCIFAGNDSMAKKIMTFFHKAGYKVPDEIALAGFDDAVFASTMSPSLSTVKVYRYEMGDLAVERIRQLLYDENVHPIKISLHTSFIKRDSSL